VNAPERKRTWVPITPDRQWRAVRRYGDECCNVSVALAIEKMGGHTFNIMYLLYKVNPRLAIK